MIDWVLRIGGPSDALPYRPAETSQTVTKIADYAETASKRMTGIKDISSLQASDPGQPGEIMIALTQEPNPPRYAVLSATGSDNATKQHKARLDEIQD